MAWFLNVKQIIHILLNRSFTFDCYISYMKTALFVLAIFLTGAMSANAADYSFIEQKREQAQKDKMMMLEQIQQTKSNPNAFMNKPEVIAQSVSFKVASNGHYYIPVSINGSSVNFIADTGASSIFLTQTDAKRIGINTDNLNYTHVYNTANGQVKAADTLVGSFKVGPIELGNIPVTVSSGGGTQSLLGMSFFSRLNRYEVKNSMLTLYK